MGGCSRAAWLVGAAWLAACGGGFTAPIDDKAPFEFAFDDPADDVLPLPEDDPTAVPADLIGVTGRVEGDRITLILTFAAPVVPWSQSAPNSLDGFIDFDLDESSATGVPGAARDVGGNPGVGAEFYLDLRDARKGRVALVDARARTFQLVAAAFGGETVTIEVPRSALDPDDGEFLLSLVVGSATHPTSDIAPNVSHFVVHRPNGAGP